MSITLTPEDRETLVSALTFADLAAGKGSSTQLEAWRELEWRRCAASPAYFLDRYGWILMKDGSVQRWALWPVQTMLLEQWQRHESTVAVKARQLGITTLSAHFALWECMFKEASRWTLVSASEEKARDIISRVQATKDRLPTWMLDKARSKTETPNRKYASDAITRITFGLSEMKIVTSTSKSIKGAIGNFILDEFTEHLEQKRKYHMLLPAMNGGGMGIIIANGEGQDYFYHIYQQAKKHENHFTAHFFSWKDDPSRDEAWYADMKRAFMLDNPELDEYAFLAQYPNTEEEAFFISGNSRFDLGLLNSILDDIREEGHNHKTGVLEVSPAGYTFHPMTTGKLRVYEPPTPSGRYVIGADPSGGGRAGDYGVMQVCRISTSGVEQVAVYQGKVEPSLFAYELEKLGHWYNDAFIVVEANNHGGTVIDNIRDGYFNLYMRKRFKNRFITPDSTDIGFWTDQNSKPKLVNQLASWLHGGQMRLHDVPTVTELSRYQQDPEDSKKTSAPKGANDDCVMALALAVEGAEDLDQNYIQADVRAFNLWE